jgi:hypothetical protein
MEERRIGHRWDLLLFLPTYDMSSNEFLGYIADLTDNGFLVFSAEHIELGREYALEIRGSDLKEALLDAGVETPLRFRARTRWVDLDVKPAFHRTGFMFTELSEETKTGLHQLVKNVARNLQ